MIVFAKLQHSDEVIIDQPKRACELGAIKLVISSTLTRIKVHVMHLVMSYIRGNGIGHVEGSVY
ncbi:hypothetical protein C1H46_043034 [Malus baccata]|uniref:Uncharacterized protein n=1 Tax=Malus baccata TaxID=106549 RepID=A0A540KB22_MALBA|nr:hypothetical protein C1H46_043034 [Malus baccata]